MITGRRRVIVGGVLVLALNGAGAAAAAIAAGSPVDGNGVVHGCYTTRAINGSHVLMLQDTGSTCPRGTTAITWNQKGPAGPPGTDSTDYGHLQIDQSASGNTYVTTCTLSDVTGPDATNITVAPDSLEFNPANTIQGCLISGLPSGSTSFFFNQTYSTDITTGLGGGAADTVALDATDEFLTTPTQGPDQSGPNIINVTWSATP